MLHTLDAHQSKTIPLPSELFFAIFQHACPTPDIFDRVPILTPPFHHLVLRLVSRSWYNIVQSMPQLWACIVLLGIRAQNVDAKGRFLKLCLDNSGSVPLTLYFQFEPELWKVNGFISPIADATLKSNTHRIQALRLFLPPRSWLEYLIPQMGQLATIHIYSHRPYLAASLPRRQDQGLILPQTTNLSRIYISYPYLSNFRFECVMTSITHVELYELPIDFAMEILLRCPNLIDFDCLYPRAASKVKDPRTILTSPLVLSHLSTFTWSTTQIADRVSEWDIALFEHIHFPALKRFNWWPDRCIPVGNTTLAQSLSRFPKSLTTLELGELDIYSPADILGLKMFLPLTGVIQLRFLHCDRHFVEQAFSVLSHETDRSNILFPKLTSIVIDHGVTGRGTPRWPEFGLESGKKLVEMLRSRVGLMDEFTLTVESVPLTQDWDDEVWHSLKELKRDGLDLTIIEYGYPIIF